ncbi:MAG: cytochrome c maturation protein CcmE [Shewanellaceae bacterium]|nr:cytochrome c maturation protein CcmE [Shewanellaceae bacterium]
MSLRRKKRLWFGCALVVASGLMSWLVVVALSQNMNLFYLPSEVLHGKIAQPDLKPSIGQHIRVGGMVVEGSVQRNVNTMLVSFGLRDKTDEHIIIQFEGLLPDLFREGQGIVAQGTLVNRNTLVANEVLAKHDETYVPPELKAAMSAP